MLPETFVGQAAQLITLLQLVCGEMALMFEQLEWTMPPWRTYSAFASRWLSGSCLDTMVPVAGQGGSTAAEVQAFIATCNTAAGSAGSSPTKTASPGACTSFPLGALHTAGAPAGAAGAAPGAFGAACEGEGLMQRAERAVSQRLVAPHAALRPHLIRVGFEVSRMD
jgi:hypothetical protein